MLAVRDQVFLFLSGLAFDEYLLLAGLYRPASGERLPILDGPTGPAPQTVLLGRVVVAAQDQVVR